jgi:predicted nucleotidyltransferase
VLLNEVAYDKFMEAKTALSLELNKKLSFGDLILYLAKKDITLLNIEKKLKDYILSFAEELKQTGFISGAMLFGSIVKGTYTKQSDIDILVLTKRSFSETIGKINNICTRFEKQAELLYADGLPSFFSPVVLTIPETTVFRPIYLDIVDYGVKLFDEDGSLSKFVNNQEGIRHWRESIDGKEVLKWAANTR